MEGKRLFLKDNAWFFVYNGLFFCFIGAYEAMDGFKKEKSYFFLLAVFFFSISLFYRYERTKSLYNKLANEEKIKLEKIGLQEEKAPIELAYKKKMEQVIESYKNQETSYEQEKTVYKEMINQWIHQMKTPLSVIGLISENRKEDKDFREILSEIDRLNYQLTQVLNMAKLEEAKHDLKIEKVSLYDISRHAVNEMKNLFIQREIYPSLEMKKELYVYSDKKWLEFILHQFLSNAVKYSEKGTKILIKAKQTDAGVILSVVDYGCGISKSDMPYIFDLFYTGSHGKSRGESTGLGLYMVKQIVDYLGHEVEAEAVEEKGTRMSIKFNENITRNV